MLTGPPTGDARQKDTPQQEAIGQAREGRQTPPTRLQKLASPTHIRPQETLPFLVPQSGWPGPGRPQPENSLSGEAPAPACGLAPPAILPIGLSPPPKERSNEKRGRCQMLYLFLDSASPVATGTDDKRFHRQSQ